MDVFVKCVTTKRKVLIAKLRDTGFASHQILPFLATASAKIDKVVTDFNAVDLRTFDFQDLIATVRWKIELEKLARTLEVPLNAANRGLEILMLSVLELDNSDAANGKPLEALLSVGQGGPLSRDR